MKERITEEKKKKSKRVPIRKCRVENMPMLTVS